MQAYDPIGSYAIIGDCHTAALVSRNGSIDWYCPQRFDSPAVFLRLLDAEKGGFFQVAPEGPFTSERRYRDRTNILETTFHPSSGGEVRLTDFMQVRLRQKGRRYDVGTARRVVRIVEGRAGQTTLRVSFKPTFDYARAHTHVEIVHGKGIVCWAGREYLALTCHGVTFEPDGQGAVAGTLQIAEGQRHAISLACADDQETARRSLNRQPSVRVVDSTARYWEDWSRRCTYRGPYQQQVTRSALALKLLTYEPTGAVIAAPTTSLPEDVGGVRNWDYRYTWLRDSALILYALATIGYEGAGADFLRWLHTTCTDVDGQALQIMYGIDGARNLPEMELSHLDGYAHSRPVRVGNAAAEQRQLDIYGEVMRAAYVHYRHESAGGREEYAVRHSTILGAKPSRAMWRTLRRFVEEAACHWQEPDNGIWEVRGGTQKFLYSRLMCWAALDRGIRLANEHHLPAPLDRWKRTEQEIRQAILTEGFNPSVGAFTQAFGSTSLDATALTIPVMGFLPARDPRFQSTLNKIQETLAHNGLVYRYRGNDGFPGGEGTFTLCTLWLVDALTLSGRVDEARSTFENVLSYANDVGLLSEELDPKKKALLGNFPQGFTHLAIIGAAVNLENAARHGEEREAETEGERAARARHT